MHTSTFHQTSSQSLQQIGLDNIAGNIPQGPIATGSCLPRKQRQAGDRPCTRTSTRRSSHHDQSPANGLKTGQAPSNSTRHNSRTVYGFGRSSNIYILLIVLITCLSPLVAATPTPPSLPSQIFPPTSRQSVADSIQESDDINLALVRSGTLLIDPRPNPLEYLWTTPSTEPESRVQVELRRRQTSTTSSGSATTVAPTTSKTTATTASSAASSTATSSNPLPVIFDSSIGANFTAQTCPDFINGFLQNATFKACLPFSLLLKNSISFFQASKSLVRITQVLDASCAANMTSCTTYLNNIATNLTSSANCAADYALQNPVVTAARLGLIAYKPMYQASCLKNPSTSSYCFADAITNTSSYSDSYIYSLPLNESLVGGTQPTCNSCLQNTMAVFDTNAANRSQPIASTYVSAASLINAQCGPGFVNATLPAAAISPAGKVEFPGAAGLVALVVCVGAWLL